MHCPLWKRNALSVVSSIRPWPLLPLVSQSAPLLVRHVVPVLTGTGEDVRFELATAVSFLWVGEGEGPGSRTLELSVREPPCLVLLLCQPNRGNGWRGQRSVEPGRLLNPPEG